jgi:hypothetical protein
MPPSMLMAVPVMDACSGLAKNIIALAISDGETNLPIGCLASSAVRAAFESAD